MSELSEEITVAEQPTQRPMGLLQTTSLVTGNLVGSGVFLLPASLAVFGSLTLIAWVLTGLGALMLAWIFAKLSMHSKQNGGPHNFIVKAYGKEYGYWVAWGYWVLSWISNAALIVAAVSYASTMLGGLSIVQTLIFELSILFGITFINILGLKFAGRFELCMTCLKLVPLVGIPLVGLFYVDWSQLSFSLNESIGLSTGLKSAMFLTIWGFIGLETATVASGEVSNPQKTIPIATLAGTSLALLVYVLGSFVMFALLGAKTLSSSSAPYADLAGFLFSANWNTFIAISAIICCLGSFNGWTMVVGRIAQGAANEDLFPKMFAQTNNNGTPVFSIVISACCTLPILLLSLGEGLIGQFNMIIDISITLILLVYTACILAFIKLLGSELKLSHCIVVFGSALFVAFSIYASGLKMVLFSLLLLALGWPMRYWRNLEFKAEGLRVG